MPDTPKHTADILSFPRKPEPEPDQPPPVFMFDEPDEATKARHIKIMTDAFNARTRELQQQHERDDTDPPSAA